MHTTHLTDEQVHAYLRDLGTRLRQSQDGLPAVWVAVGGSGSVLAKYLAELVPDLYETADELIVAYDRATDVISYPAKQSPKVLRGKRALIIDGTVHSGSTLLRIIRELQSYRPASVASYALAVRKGAKVIPNFFGFLIGDHDRVQFPATEFHNNRLCPFGVYRKLAETDVQRPMIKSGRKFIDKVSWEDRWYEITTDPHRQIYLHEHNGLICGFVSFRFQDDRSILVDEVATDKKFQSQSLGGCLLRWAEHCGRHSNCLHVDLWAIEDRVPWYNKRGFHAVDGIKALALSGLKFHRLRKKLLYNLPGDDVLGMGA